MRSALIGLGLDIAFLYAFYTWKVHGVEGAGNLWIASMAYQGFAGTVLLLGSLAKTGPTKAPPVAPEPLRSLGIFMDLVATGVMVWHGHFFMAVVPFYGRLAMIQWREGCEKRAAAAKESGNA